MKNNCLTVTYLVKTSLASLNGSDKEADNLSSIKKFTSGDAEYPYGSSQWARRGLRDQLGAMGWPLSQGQAATIDKGAATTLQDPASYIDDDLFGFMGTVKGQAATKRTSPVRVSPLVALSPFRGDLDFGTNYMSVKDGGNPNIFETEIHSGFYRGTVLIELDRVGADEGFKAPLSSDERAKRVNALLDSLRVLWSSGRQSRYLADISPKFVAGALMSAKNPLFLESLLVHGDDVPEAPLAGALEACGSLVTEHVYGARDGVFGAVPEGTCPIGKAFDIMKNWVDRAYSEGV